MSADLARPVVLRAGARLLSAARLPAHVREATGARRGEHALVVEGARASSLLVDAATAALLRRLTTPRRVADVLLEIARERAAEPDDVLDAAFPVLARLARDGWLVDARDAERASGPALAIGDRVGDGARAWEVVDRLRALEDTENYQVRNARGRVGMLKLVRARAGGWLDGALAREARALRRLRGGVSPRLLAEGRLGDAGWLVTAWREGVHLPRAAAECRVADDDGRAALALARAVAHAYARLHAAGVVHGDVHPANVLVDREGAVSLLDFGHAVVTGDRGPAPMRAGLPEFHEPELAQALRVGAPPVPATARGEQHAVGALLFELFTGRRWQDFSLVRDDLLRQVVEAPPLAFADAGARPWRAVERVLARALAKRPADRWPDLAALARALDGIAPPRARVRATVPPTHAAAARRRAFADAVVHHARPDGGWSVEWPRGTRRVAARDGAAGVAYALHRVAAARDDARVLGWARLWAERAWDAARRRPDALFARTGALSRAQLGDASFHHLAAGVHAVRALVARAAGDLRTFDAAARAFAAAPRVSPHAADLSFGAPGLLLGAALLRDAGESAGAAAVGATAAVCDAGDDLARAVLAAVRGGEGRARPGAAHGLAGALAALLAWHRGAAPAALRAPLRELAALALPLGRGLRWAWEQRSYGLQDRPRFVGGWCNGSAGYAHLFLAAHERLGGDAHLDLATRAAWHAWESAPGGASLCCGDTGRAYALLALFRRTGDAAWLHRATALADRAMLAAGAPEQATPGLYQGTLGVAVLLAELERPGEARMPLVEMEGWGAR